MNSTNQKKFEEEIQRILEKFDLSARLRREIFSQIIEHAGKQNKKITETSE